MEYKVDVDYKKWADYKRWFKYAYTQLYIGGLRLQNCVVYKTKHGYHIYFYDSTVKGTLWNNMQINLIECLLGSDVNRQLYFWAEGVDILFKRKGNSREVHEVSKSDSLRRIIVNINMRKPYIHRYTIDM